MRRPFILVDVLLVLALFSAAPWAVTGSSQCRRSNSGVFRPHSVSITEFGAVGDGVTLNTKAFQNAIFYLNSFADKGGAKLFVPAGRWLTGSFDLISHLTLSLDKDAVILGSTYLENWPVIDPLPSYGRGRELPGGRHRSLIFGWNLTDVVITGDNGTIDGQGSIWWEQFRNGTLDYTRPHLVELMNSTGIVISNLTFLNPPFWTIHPVYCRFVGLFFLQRDFYLFHSLSDSRILLFNLNCTKVKLYLINGVLRLLFWMNNHVIVQNVTIRAPLDSPNTDGIDPDSSDDVCIKNCYISTGDDLVSIKSGWDEYGISYGRPSTKITISGLVGETQLGSGISIGSEMSGGVSEVHAENLYFFNSVRGIRLKTSPGRGGYVRNISISNVILDNVDVAIMFTGHFGEHPDESFDPSALPTIERITIKDVTGENVKMAGQLEGIKGDTFRNICLSNIKLNGVLESPWNCSYVQGYSNLVTPETCDPLKESIFPKHYLDCYDLSSHFLSPRNKYRIARLLSW